MPGRAYINYSITPTSYNTSVDEEEKSMNYPSGYHMFLIYYTARGIQSSVGLVGNTVILITVHRYLQLRY